MIRDYLAAMVPLATYLMMPPPRMVEGRFQTNFSAPLNKWDQLRLFDSDAECEAALNSYRQEPPGGLPAMLGSRAAAVATMRAAQCISISDPRLK